MNASEDTYILYAEDDMDDRKLLSDMLTDLNSRIRLVCVNNGAELIDYLQKLKPRARYPSFILLDINMPVMDGLQTLEVLQSTAELKEIPVIVYSTTPPGGKHLSKLGGIEYMKKPVRVQDVVAATRKFVVYCRILPKLSRMG